MNLTDYQRALLAMLTAAAEAGAPCPGNREIAERGGGEDGSYTLRGLVRKGLIGLENTKGKRVVTILATGKRTAGEVTRTYRKRGRKRSPKQDENLARVERGACFLCGARFEGHWCPTCRKAAA